MFVILLLHLIKRICHAESVNNFAFLFIYFFLKGDFWPQWKGDRESQTNDLCFMRHGPQPIVLPLGVIFLLII